MLTHHPHNLPRLLAVFAAFLVFAFLLTFRLGAREMTLDETISVGHTEHAQPGYDAFHPGGYYGLLYHWRTVFGAGDGALRAFSVVCALVAAGLVWLLAQALLRPGEDVLALWLFALSPFGLLYLRMARYFALTLAVALAVAYLALLARRQGKIGHYLGLGLAAAALLRVDYVPSVLLPLVYLWLLPEALRRRHLWRWLAAAALPAASLAPRLAVALNNAHTVAGIAAGHAAAGLPAVGLKLLLPFYAALVGETTDFWRFYLTVPVALAGAALWIAGMAALARRREAERGLLLLPWPLAVVAVTVVLSTAAAAEPWPRVSSLCLFALPFFLMTVAAGVSAWGGLPARPRGAEAALAGWKPAPRGGVLGLALLALLLAGQVYGVYNYQARRQFLNPGYNAPWRQVVEQIQAQGKSGDLAVAWWDGEAQRYWRGPARFVNLVDNTLTVPEQAPEVAAFPRGGRMVWVIDRDRGSDLARELTAKLLQHLRAAGGEETQYQIMPFAPRERDWRRRLGGGPVGEAYLTLHRFTPPTP